jgi:hypothetical protein
MGWSHAEILLISASQVVRIAGISHHTWSKSYILIKSQEAAFETYKIMYITYVKQ